MSLIRILHTVKPILLSTFGQGVLWNIGSIGVLAIGGIVTNLFVVALQGPDALGVFNQIYSIYTIMSQVGVGGIQFSVLKEVSYNQDDANECADITASALLLVIILTLPICILLALAAAPIGNFLGSPETRAGLIFAAPGLFFFSVNKVLINTLNGLGWMRAFAIFRSLRFILIPIIIVIVAILHLDAAYLALSLTISELILSVMLLGFVYGQLIPLRKVSHLKQRVLQHLSFGLRGIMSGILTTAGTRIDIIMLGYFTTDAVVGVYSFAATLAEGFAQFPIAIRWNIDPVMGRYFSQNETHKISELSAKVKRTFFPLMALIGLGAVILYPLIFGFFLEDNEIVQSWEVFAILAVGIVISAGYRPFWGLLLQGGKPAIHTVLIMGVVLCNILLNYTLIPYLGMNGAAIATTSTYLFEALGLVLFANRLFGVRL